MNAELSLAANATPRVGGQGLNLEQMIDACVGRFRVRLYSRGGHPACQSRTIPGSRLASLLGRTPVLRRWRDWQTWLGDVAFDRQVARRLECCDLFQGATGQCLKSLRRAKALGARTALDVVTTHIDDFARHQHRECAVLGVRPAIHPRHQARMRAEYLEADLLRVMSTHAQRTFIERGFDPARVVVVHPFVRAEEFPEATFQEPGFRVCFVGLLEPWKGFHHLIAAFDDGRWPDSELVLWGGPGSRPVSRFLRDHMQRNPAIKLRPVSIRSVGYAEVYGRASVLVQPSLTDGFGLVVAEAMASGLPVVVTANTGAADWVAEGRNGFVVPAGQPAALQARLRWLAQNPSSLRALGQCARQTARRFTLETFRDSYLPHLERLASNT